MKRNPILCPRSEILVGDVLFGPWGTQKVGATSSSSDPPSWLCCGTEYDLAMFT